MEPVQVEVTRDQWSLRCNDLCFTCLLLGSFNFITVNLDDTTVKFGVWDTAGQERSHSLAPMYYRGAQAAIVVYDITNQVRVMKYLLSFVF